MGKLFSERYGLTNKKMTRCMFGKETEYEKRLRERMQYLTLTFADTTSTYNDNVTINVTWVSDFE